MNPFKKNYQMLPIASINSVYIDDILASDLFKPDLIINEINKNRESLEILKTVKDSELLLEFNYCLASESKDIKEKSYMIANTFGKKLAKVIIALKKPSQKSIDKRLNWQEIHWNFWKTVKKIYFVGGLTSPILTSIFYNQIQIQLKIENITDLDISFIEGSTDLGTKGLSALVKNGEYLLFDFGQTYIKRRHILKNYGDTVIDSVLLPVNSNHLLYKNKNKNELYNSASKLDDYITNIIIETSNLAAFKGSDIFMAIANYVYDGSIYLNRGGYGKLAYISENYESYLSNKISIILDREINLKLFHDTSAMALNFKNHKRTAVMSLGTAFGIAFPE